MSLHSYPTNSHHEFKQKDLIKKLYVQYIDSYKIRCDV